MQKISEGSIYVYTFKDGALSRMAHDLRLSLQRFEVKAEPEEEGTVSAEFWLETLRVDGAVKNGVLDEAALSAKDKDKIHRITTTKVLDTRTAPKALFTGRFVPAEGAHWPAGRIRGELMLQGSRAPLELEVRVEDGRARGEVELRPSKWDIAPYEALGGMLKLKDCLRVIWDLELR